MFIIFCIFLFLYVAITHGAFVRMIVGLIQKIDTPNERQKHLKEKIHHLANQMGLRKNIRLYSGGPFIQALGSAFIPWSQKGIILPRDFEEQMTEWEESFVMKHEMSHIKNNDLLLIMAIPVTFCIFSTYFGILERVVAGSLPFIIAFISVYREKIADTSYLDLLSADEIQGGISFLNRRRAKQRKYCDEKQKDLKFQSLPFYHWKKIIHFIQYDKNNEVRDWLHPLPQTRINNLAKACKRIHNVELDKTVGL